MSKALAARICIGPLHPLCQSQQKSRGMQQKGGVPRQPPINKPISRKWQGLRLAMAFNNFP